MEQPANSTDPSQVLATATRNAAKALKVRQADLALIVGRSRTKIADGINPESKTGELALMFVRVYRSLYALFGGDADLMAAWLRDNNTALGGVPVERMQSVTGLADVVAYLDAMRAKV
jgi:hypothetical protein